MTLSVPRLKSRLPLPSGRAAVVPSILSADLCFLGREVAAVERTADWLQIDVMDGHFVPNISFGPAVVKALRARTKLALDAHLMVENPGDFINAFAAAGADLVTVHLEAARKPLPVLNAVRRAGLKAGLAINPETPVEAVKPFIGAIDLLLLMTVHPGFGGQQFLPGSLERIAAARRLIKASGRPVWLQVDGGICLSTAPRVAAAGADCLVAGHAVFAGAGGPRRALTQIRKSLS